jgi:preprotein translocase subunit SecG
MQLLTNIVLIVQILSAVVMIGLVLIQHGKGADMGASFGGGASGSLFGATGSANFLSRSTAVCAGVFFICTLALAFVSGGGGKVRGSGETVLDRPASAASAPASAVAPGAVIPGAVIPGAASAAAPAAPAVPASR